MNRAKITRFPVTHRSKGNINPDPEAGNLADEPEMKTLSKMIDAGEVDPDRTLDYLKAKTETNLEKKSNGGEGVADLGMGLLY
jgi:hypothetical protein